MAFRLIRTTLIFQTRQNVNNKNIYFKSINNSNLIRISFKSHIASEAKHTGNKSWRSIIKGFVPIGICLIAVMQWRAFRKISSSKVASQWEINFYCSLPLRSFSRTWGWIAERRMPELMRPWIYGLYSSMFSVNLDEAVSNNLKDYISLAEFFARPLKNGIRPVDTRSCLTAPCDGTVLHFGPVTTCKVEQVKGVTYSLEEFLTGEREKGNGQGEDFRRSLLNGQDTRLYQCVLYLAPGDYHRFHSPAEWQPECRKHFSGELLSVSPRIAKWIPSLFVINERAVYTGKWQHGFFSFTPVGATNVGCMKVYFDRHLHTNLRKPSNKDCTKYLRNISLNKGDMIGEFRMGSTIVLIFEAPNNFQFNLSTGQRVRVGEAIGNVTKVTETKKIMESDMESSNRVTTMAA